MFIFGDGTDVAAARIARDEMGYEGANVIFDTWIHPLVMGLEEHLPAMFRDDFEFHDAAGASHHGGHGPKAMERKELSSASGGDIFTQKNAEGSKFEVITAENIIWLSDAGRALKKIPFFMRDKARHNTETFALQKAITQISIDTLYAAKAHYAR